MTEDIKNAVLARVLKSHSSCKGGYCVTHYNDIGAKAIVINDTKTVLMALTNKTEDYQPNKCGTWQYALKDYQSR